MKRISLSLNEIAEWDNLCDAAYKAGRGKHSRKEVAEFFADFEGNIDKVRSGILCGMLPEGTLRHFVIHDPKVRLISAFSFTDRLIHHALMNFLGPVLDKTAIEHSYACRKGRGPHKGIAQVQRLCRKYPYFIQGDIGKFFDSVDHQVLISLLKRKVKGPVMDSFVPRILSFYSTGNGTGLPIGALTSQYFANFYLNPLDRFVLSSSHTRGYVRYMDDFIIFSESPIFLKSLGKSIEQMLQDLLRLNTKKGFLFGKSNNGIGFCGVKIFPGQIRLTNRKKKSYLQKKKYWEHQYSWHKISSQELQQAMDAVNSIVCRANSLSWCKSVLGWS